MADFLAQEESTEARQEAMKALRRIADNPNDDKATREAAGGEGYEE